MVHTLHYIKYLTNIWNITIITIVYYITLLMNSIQTSFRRTISMISVIVLITTLYIGYRMQYIPNFVYAANETANLSVSKTAIVDSNNNNSYGGSDST